ncbi:MAG: hydrogenase nickel incorporation protein HypB [Acidobacteriota bacterium]|nr:MAG: hydrogenase nickel incorporation protein HypB [Acidobacteriota bacterium]
MTEPTKIDVKRRILESNELAAAKLRQGFSATGTLVVNLISSPGSGKTTLLESTIGRLSGLKVAVLEGDIATERDADRIRKLGVPARQILTGGSCHLDARQIQREIVEEGFANADILFIENVGNLICPTAYDLGEDFKIALLSVSEGDDKPFKYPGIFSKAAVTIITKIDLLDYVDFDLEAVEDQIRSLNQRSVILKTSARAGTHLDEWCAFLRSTLEKKRGGAGPLP